MSVDDIIALLTQWKATQEEVLNGLQSNILARDQMRYHLGLRDAYTAILIKIQERTEHVGVV